MVDVCYINWVQCPEKEKKIQNIVCLTSLSNCVWIARDCYHLRLFTLPFIDFSPRRPIAKTYVEIGCLLAIQWMVVFEVKAKAHKKGTMLWC